MTTTTPNGLRCPEDLACPDDMAKAHAAIMAVLTKNDTLSTGGCKAFYSPTEWKARGEQYGENAILVIVHDGGDLAPYFNYDYECYGLIEEMSEALKAVGMFAEAQTTWYSAVYPI